MIKILNVPRKCQQKHIEAFLIKRIKDMKIDKIILDIDLQTKLTRSIFLTSDHRPTLESLLRLHYVPWIKGPVKTLIMGYGYNED